MEIDLSKALLFLDYVLSALLIFAMLCALVHSLLTECKLNQSVKMLCKLAGYKSFGYISYILIFLALPFTAIMLLIIEVYYLMK